MRMNGSMDKREFDGGNPQQDAPRRVEKKRIWTRRRLLWLGIVAAVLLAVVAVSLLWQRGTFDGLRRSVIYARAEKDENGCAQLYQYAADREYRFVSLSGSLAAASNSRIVPSTFVRMNGSGSKMELSLCDSAAKCTMASQPGTMRSSSDTSQISPMTSSTCDCGSPSMFAGLPAYVSLSSTVMCTSG